MTMHRLIGLVLVTASLGVPAHAAMIRGGKNPSTDCYARFRVGEGTELLATRTATCTDNDPGCDHDPESGSCLFEVALCLNQSDDPSTCAPPGPGEALVKVTPQRLVKKLGLEPPADLASVACGNTVRVPVKLTRKGREPGQKKIKSVAISPSRPRKDVDVVTLRCVPETAAPACEALAECVNPDGGPDELDLAVADSGTDLDNGWTGIAHDFQIPPRSGLKLCLSGCDADSNPVCNVCGPTGEGSLNGPVFGPPLPLITQGVPVCVVNRYQPGPITGKINVQTGEVSTAGPIRLHFAAGVHFTFPDAVCPRCAGPGATDYGGAGRCDGGENDGATCQVESILTIPLADGDKVYRLSSSCPPSRSQSVGTLDIDIPLTTGTATLTGDNPCQARGGNRNPERIGKSAPATDGNGRGWPDGTYPKTTADGVLVATFCEPATEAGIVNSTAGLPGPGALVLPGTHTLLER